MVKKQEDRLGAGDGDAEDIKAHPFFQDMDFARLMKREVRPPFVPELKNPTDVVYFSKEFTEMRPSGELELESQGGNDAMDPKGSFASNPASEWTGFSFTGSTTANNKT